MAIDRDSCYLGSGPARDLSRRSKFRLDGATVSGRSLNPCVDLVAERQEIDRFGQQIVGAAL